MICLDKTLILEELQTVWPDLSVVQSDKIMLALEDVCGLIPGEALAKLAQWYSCADC